MKDIAPGEEPRKGKAVNAHRGCAAQRARRGGRQGPRTCLRARLGLKTESLRYVHTHGIRRISIC